MATYDLTPAENAQVMTWFLEWADKRSKNLNGTTNTWSKESQEWLRPANTPPNGRDGNDGAPSYVIGDLSHNLGSYEVKEDCRPKIQP